MLPFLLALFIVMPMYHLYIGFRLIPDLPLGGVATGISIGVLAASALLIPLAMLSRRMPQPSAARLAWAGFIAMGLFSSLLVLTLLRDIVLLGLAAAGYALDWRAIDAVLAPFQRWSAMAVPAIALLASVAGFHGARRLAPTRIVDVPVNGLPAALAGLRIVQLTDIHVGATIRRPYLEAIVDAANALAPDVIAITGDLVDGTVDQLAWHTAPLARLRARHGAHFVTGNHEYYSGVHSWIDELRRLGISVLMNEHVVLAHDGTALLVAGVTDYSAHQFDAAHRSDPALALRAAPGDVALKILLAHQPRSAPAAACAGFDLQLSGHTHGGQFWPWPWFVRLQQPFTAGLHRMGAMWVYTSRGAGYWGPPLRLGAPSEITLLRLQAA